MPRCQAALDIVQRNLDVTGYRPSDAVPISQPRGWPPSVFAALPDRLRMDGAWVMTSRMEGASLLLQRGRVGFFRHA